MTDAALGRGHRAIHKTQFMLDHAPSDQAVKDSEGRRENLKRKKYVREQEAELAIEDEAEELLAATVAKSSKSGSKASTAGPSTKPSTTKSSSGSQAASRSGDKGDGSTKRCEQLIKFLIARDDMDRDELEVMSLTLLEKIWKLGDSSSAMSPARIPARIPAKTPAKTPAKALARSSTIQLLGSPLDALHAAKGKSSREADNTPIVSNRKRRNSSSDLDDLDDFVKRPRIDQASKGKQSTIKPFKPSKPPSLATSRSSSRTPSIHSKHSGSRAGSAAPTSISVNSAVRAGPSKYKPSAGGLPDVDEEMIEFSGEELDIQVLSKGKKRAVKEPGAKGKSKPKCSDYEGMWLKLVDETYYLVCSRLGHDGMFPEKRVYDRLIRKSWATAAEELGVDAAAFLMDDDHEACVKRRVDSFRGRVRSKIQPHIIKVYDIAGKTGERLVQHIKKLRAGEFHKTPGVKGGAGNYQHPFLVECVYNAYFNGRKPIGVLFPELYDPVPLPALAYVCAMVEFLLSLYETGEYKESRAEAKVLDTLYKSHLPNLELFQECRPSKCEKYRGKLYKEAMKLARKPVKSEKETRTGPGVLTAADFEDEGDDESEDEGSNAEDDEKPRKSAPPAKSSSHDRVSPTKSSSRNPASSNKSRSRNSASPNKSGSRNRKPLQSKHDDSSSEGSSPLSESGDDSADDDRANGSKGGDEKPKARVKPLPKPLLKPRPKPLPKPLPKPQATKSGGGDAVGAAVGDPQGVEGADIGYDHQGPARAGEEARPVSSSDGEAEDVPRKNSGGSSVEPRKGSSIKPNERSCIEPGGRSSAETSERHGERETSGDAEGDDEAGEDGRGGQDGEQPDEKSRVTRTNVQVSALASQSLAQLSGTAKTLGAEGSGEDAPEDTVVAGQQSSKGEAKRKVVSEQAEEAVEGEANEGENGKAAAKKGGKKGGTEEERQEPAQRE
ncbi:hypothetical protein FS749_000318 [Ceratobasidium sp. UAMH 11750]|nr:hypothetical protein FS749_000318 [Ceratobasidium sp. UAMH 11750]